MIERGLTHEDGFEMPYALMRLIAALLFACALPGVARAGASGDAPPADVAAFAAKNLPIAQNLARNEPYVDEFGFSVAANERFAAIGAPSQRAGELNFAVGAVYVYARVNSATNQPWRYIQTIYGEDHDTTDADADRFGESVALSGTTLVVGSPGDDPVNVTPTARTGSVYVFTFDLARAPTPGFTFRRKIRAFDASLAADGNQFGGAVALAGRHLVVGAPGHDGGASDAGAIAFFDCPRVASPTFVSCTFRQRVLSPDPNVRGFFGRAVSATLPLRGVAGAALVGAPNNCETGTCTNGTGAAYLYALPAAGTIPAGLKITAPDAATNDQFGYSVALDGPVAAIGARGDNLGVGSVYVYARTTTGAGFEARLSPPAFQAMAFGSSLDLRGGALAVGAPRRSNGTQPSQHGAVFVFENVRGTFVRRDEVFRTQNPIDTNVFFGHAVALGGGYLLVGEPEGPGITFGRPGVAWAYAVGRNARMQRQGNPNSLGPATDEYGADVAVSGRFMAVGLPNRQSLQAASVGEVRLYERTSGGAWAPTNQGAIAFPDGASVANARFGQAVAFTEDAQHLVVGAPGATEGTAGAVGAVYVFERQGSFFLPAVQGAKLVRPAGVAGDEFGASLDVSPSANLLIVGAPSANGGVGGVTVFRDPTAPAPKSGKVGRAKFDDGGNVPPPPAAGIGDKWGSSVATDGEQAVAGAPETDDPTGDGYATAIGDPDGDGSFDNTDTMLPPEDAGGEGSDEQDFGSSVAIEDGMAAVGAPGTDVPDEDAGGTNDDEGMVYGYDLGGGTASDPVPLDQPGGEIGDKWGSSVDIDDGGIVSGGPGTDVPTDSGTSTDQGAVSSYDCYYNAFGLIECGYTETLYGNGAGAAEGIGSSVDANGGEIILGAPRAGSQDEGAVYVTEDLFPIDGLFRNGFE